jgi:hypothetical protein
MATFEPYSGLPPNNKYVYIGSDEIVRPCEYHIIHGAGHHVCDMYCCPGKLRMKSPGTGSTLTVCPFRGGGKPKFPELFAEINE